MTKRLNPWELGLTIGALTLIVIGSVIVVGLLVGVVAGWLPATPGYRVFAGALLAIIFTGIFVRAMSLRWDTKNREQ